MIDLIFWVVVVAIFAASAYFWAEERRVKQGGKTLVDEVTAYLTKRKGPL